VRLRGLVAALALLASPIGWAANAFDVAVTAPAEVRPTLERHLDILRYRELPDLTPAELAQLTANVPDDVRALLGALGHFAPTIQVQTVAPDPATPQPPTVRITVEPGPAARVASVHLTVHAAADDTDHLTRQLAAQWPLAKGSLFTQAAWDDAKTQTLTRLTQRLHPGARLVGSLADVDGDQAAVHLHLEFDAGPAFALGPLQVEGLARYEADWVRRIAAQAGLIEGLPYDLTTLQDAQQQLAQSGYFESVYVHVDPAEAASVPAGHNTQASPVHIQVREARRGKLVLGLGGSTDSGPRLSAEHTVLRLPWLWDARAHSQVKLERDTRSAQTELSLPLDASGWRWTAGAKAERLEDTGKTTTQQQISLGRARDTTALDRRITLQLDQSRVSTQALRQAGLDTPDLALSLHHRWQRRQYDTLPFPNEGHTLTVETGLGWVLHPTRQPFARAAARWQGLWPLASAREGRIAWRAEGGAIVAKDSARVPEAMRFLAGGDQSVRGYALRSIGVAASDGTVNAGRWMATGSLEWQRPWPQADGSLSPWESTVFADVGAVANRVSALQAHWGVGAGVRYRTPVGPLQADLAYGLKTRQFRLHLSAGFVF
jgi:translocation and assembly module TamA